MVRKQLFYSLIFSYIVVVIVAIGLYTSVNIIAIREIEEETIKNYTSMVENLAVDMNYILDDISEIIIDITQKVSIRELLYVEKERQYQENYKFVQAIQGINEVKVYNSYIENVYIYYKDHDVILNKKGTYSPEVAYKVFHKENQSGYNSWLNALNSKNPKGHLKKVNDQLVYIQTIFANNKKSQANIIILFNERRLKTLINDSSFAGYGSIGVLDEADNIVISSIEDITEEEEFKKDISTEKSIKNNKYKILSKKDFKNNLEYVGIIKNKVFQEKISYINNIFLICTAIFISILLMGIYVIYKKYEHVKKLLHQVKNVTGIGQENQYGEIEYIEKAIIQMSKELKSEKYLIVENILRKAIQGAILNKEHVEKYLGKEFVESEFIMGGLIVEEKKDEQHKDKLNEFILQNILREVLGEAYKLYIMDYHSGYILIIGFVGQLDEYIYEEAIHRLSVGRTFLEEKFNSSYILAISERHKKIESLFKACEEVEIALEYRMLFREEKIVYYSQVIREDSPYVYSMEDYLYLSKYIKEGKRDQSLGVIDKIFNQNFSERGISLEKTKKLINDISITLKNIADELNIEIIESRKNSSNQTNLEAIRKEIEKGIELLCQQVKGRKEKRVDNKIKSILEHIGNNYCEETLTVTSIAQKFDMKVSYLSRFFKENTEENLLQYITKVRISQAKELLINTDLNLNEIARQVGLLNNIALIRSFKKYEYMTPNEYRNKNK